jgi:hypothetical protein
MVAKNKGLPRWKKPPPNTGAVTVTIPLGTRKAYHEAAHAVFALEHGTLQDEGLSLTAPAGTPAGAGGGVAIMWTEIEKLREQEITEVRRQYLAEDIFALLAGTVAEMLLLHSNGAANFADMMNLHVGAVDDIREALLRLELGGPDPYLAFRDAMSLMPKKVSDRWDAIELVAKEALVKQKLSKSEIFALVERAEQAQAKGR